MMVEKELKEVAIIFNPEAGMNNHRQKQIDLAAKEFQDSGYHVEEYLTSGPGDATELARTAQQKGKNVIISAGGDGTMNEVLQGIESPHTVLGCLPFGTINVWASEVGTPSDPVKAAKELAEGEVRTIDIGELNQRKFILHAGIGYDADLIMETQEPGRIKKCKGALSYFRIIARTIWNYPSHKAKVTIADKEVELDLLQAIFSNTRQYANFILQPDPPARIPYATSGAGVRWPMGGSRVWAH